MKVKTVFFLTGLSGFCAQSRVIYACRHRKNAAWKKGIDSASLRSYIVSRGRTDERHGRDGMRIIAQQGDFEENEIIIRFRERDSEVLRILALLNENTGKIAAEKDGETHMLEHGSILYAEVVDGSTFVYTGDSVFESSMSLSALHEKYEDFGFVRISKSQIVSLFHVARFRSLPNSRIQITLLNEEKLIVSRHYIYALKEKLGISE